MWLLFLTLQPGHTLVKGGLESLDVLPAPCLPVIFKKSIVDIVMICKNMHNHAKSSFWIIYALVVFQQVLLNVENCTGV